MGPFLFRAIFLVGNRAFRFSSVSMACKAQERNKTKL
jgi:hypothetical protein